MTEKSVKSTNLSVFISAATLLVPQKYMMMEKSVRSTMPLQSRSPWEISPQAVPVEVVE